MQLTTLTLALAVGGSLAQVSDSQIPVGDSSSIAQMISHTLSFQMLPIPMLYRPTPTRFLVLRPTRHLHPNIQALGVVGQVNGQRHTRKLSR